ncbi:MAG: hypothetical protein CVU59_10800 [Deltaproteobacteria bacterium HGW-Deltaproteobacteria-17]|nr:MAG: hypothetical protein CVU59_10800 [Deltaproteobacteria bacterium HGW-Deltaproteobacteria-17]
MPAQVYEELRSLLDRHPCGCPAAPEIYEILALLFSADEARVAVAMGFRPDIAAAIAARVGSGEAEVVVHLEALADRGIVFARDKNGERGYSLLPVMPGLFEFPYMKGGESELTRRLSPLWDTYLVKLGKGFGVPDTSFSRIVPIQEQIQSEPGVLPYELVYDLIEKAKVTGIAHCACREQAGRCDAPREACMLFDETCTFLVERGFARYLSKDEMKQKLREFDEAGLVHQINNGQDSVTFICNCCPCCCGLLRALTEAKNPNVLSSSGFLPRVDAERCTECGTCAERCPTKAVRDEGGVFAYEEEKCIGCGLCVTGCPQNALELVRRDGVPVPPPTMRDMGLRILTAQGRLEDFLELLNR